MRAVNWEDVPRNWATTLMFALTFAVAVTAVPWYGISHGYHASAWIWFVTARPRRQHRMSRSAWHAHVSSSV